MRLVLDALEKAAWAVATLALVLLAGMGIGAVSWLAGTRWPGCWASGALFSVPAAVAMALCLRRWWSCPWTRR